MKKVLIFFAMASVFASCDQKTDSETTKDVVGVSDSTTYKNNTMADTGHVIPPAPVVITETLRVEKRVDVVKTSKPKTTPKKTQTAPVMTPVPVNEDTKTAPVATETTTSTTPAAVPEKKGVSSAAKGAVIGGVGGAIGGAIISKKKGKGAIIGGVLGAAGGYIIGRKKDKKEQAQDTAK